MTATAHAIIGAAIATKFPDPFLSLPLAFASHFICDKIPHWDVMTNKKDKSKRRIFTESLADWLLSLILVTILFLFAFRNADPVNIFLSAFFAQLPDWLEIPYTVFNWNFSPSRLDYRFQKWLHDFLFDSRLLAPWGVLTQLATISLFLVWSVS